MAKKTTKKSTSTPKKPAVKKKPAKSTAKASAKGKTRTPAAPKKMSRPAPAAVKPVKAVKPAKAVKAKAPAPVLETKPAKPIQTKPGRNQAGLTSRELDHYRELLIAKRRELLGDVTSMEDEALRNSGGTNLSNLPIHMADMGTDNYEQEFTLGLVEKDRRVLRDIHAALLKIQNGSYGICEGTGKPISKPRLEVQPWTRFSIEHARKLEQRVRPG